MQEYISRKETYLVKTTNRLKQLIRYLRTFSPNQLKYSSNSPHAQKLKSMRSLQTQVAIKPKSSLENQCMFENQRQKQLNKTKIKLSSSLQTEPYYLNPSPSPSLNSNTSYIYNNSYRNRGKEQSDKLRAVDSFMRQIDTSLEQVVNDLEGICRKIEYYENLGARQQEIKLDRSEKEHHNSLFNLYKNQYKKQQLQIQEEQQSQIFLNIFKHIYNSFFPNSILQLTDKPPKKLAIYLLQIQSKLSLLPNLIESASKFKPDITTCALFHQNQKYSHAWRNIELKAMDNLAEVIRGQVGYLRKMMKITTSAVVTEAASYEMELLKKLVFGLSFGLFLLADEEAQLRCYRLWRRPKVESLNQVWNLPELGAIRQCKKIIFPYIKTNFFIYIPTKNFHSNDSSLQSHLIEKPQIFTQPLDHPQNSIRVLVLYNGIFNFREQSNQFQPFSCFSCLDVKQQIDLDTIIIHIHGGGFVALSSQTMQSYTRAWGNSLRVPIFSIDYRKPPNYRFPVAVYDCLTAYQFIVQKIQKYFNVKPKNIILAGDSAGGNLAVALQGLLMQRRYPLLPKGIFLAYPAVDLRIKFTPSRMNSFDDPILLPSLLFLCLKQYLGENALNQQNPLASPLLLSEYFIRTGLEPNPNINKQQKKWPKNWPPTRIMVGKKDPLYDDSLRLLERMSQSGVDVKLIIYKEFSHAFMSMNLVINACQQAIEDSIKEIRQLIEMK